MKKFIPVKLNSRLKKDFCNIQKQILCSELNEHEKFWIKVLKSKSSNDYNLSNGGAGFIRQKNFPGNFGSTSFSNRLKDLRIAKGITQAELAKILGITQQAIARWERDKTEPDADTLKQLSSYFSVSIDYLLDNEKNNCSAFSDDEVKLIYSYRNLLFGVVDFLIVSHSRKNPGENSRIIHGNSGGSNFLVTGGGNHSFNVTSV